MKFGNLWRHLEVRLKAQSSQTLKWPSWHSPFVIRRWIMLVTFYNCVKFLIKYHRYRPKCRYRTNFLNVPLRHCIQCLVTLHGSYLIALTLSPYNSAAYHCSIRTSMRVDDYNDKHLFVSVSVIVNEPQSLTPFELYLWKLLPLLLYSDRSNQLS